MSSTCAQYVIYAIFISFLPDACTVEDTSTIIDLGRRIVHDGARKGESVWAYRNLFKNYISFSMGERVYVVRARFAAMLRSYYRNFKNRNLYALNQLLRNSLYIQKRTESIYALVADLEDFDVAVRTVLNPLNWTRFDEHACHTVGPPCDLMPAFKGYSRRSTMDQALQLIESRRNFIRKKYQLKKYEPPIDIDAKLNLSFDYVYKYSTSSGSHNNHNQEPNSDFGNLAPDFMT